MTLIIAADPMVLEADTVGVIRMRGSRVTLDSVIAVYRQGYSPERIVEAFDTLDVADVYSVIGYYLRHRAEVDADLQQRAEDAAILRLRIEATPEHQAFRERLLARRASLAG